MDVHVARAWCERSSFTRIGTVSGNAGAARGSLFDAGRQCRAEPGRRSRHGDPARDRATRCGATDERHPGQHHHPVPAARRSPRGEARILRGHPSRARRLRVEPGSRDPLRAFQVDEEVSAMSDGGMPCSIIRFDIGRFGSSMEFPEVKTPSYVAEPDRPHMFEIRAPIYGVVGAFIVIEDPRSPRGAVDVSFVAKDKWFMKVARFLWPFPRWRRRMVE